MEMKLQNECKLRIFPVFSELGKDYLPTPFYLQDSRPSRAVSDRSDEVAELNIQVTVNFNVWTGI